jgi:hypothetical protein
MYQIYFNNFNYYELALLTGLNKNLSIKYNFFNKENLLKISAQLEQHSALVPRGLKINSEEKISYTIIGVACKLEELSQILLTSTLHGMKQSEGAHIPVSTQQELTPASAFRHPEF